MEIHAAPTADDARTRFLVLPFRIPQAYYGMDTVRHRLLRATDLQGRPDFAVSYCGRMSVAVKPVLAGWFVARLNNDETNIEPGILLAGKGQDPGHMNEPDRRSLGDII
jgi:hypothetical protein